MIGDDSTDSPTRDSSAGPSRLRLNSSALDEDALPQFRAPDSVNDR